MSKADIETIRKKLDKMTLYVIPYTHPDWSWCHTRQWHERRYIAVFEEVITLMEKDEAATWYMDCYTTELRPLLERKPELIGKLRDAVNSGRVAVCGAYSNVRPNMVADEAYVRNLIIGRKKFSEVFPGVDLTVHADAVDVALGHPQIPQLLKKAGYNYFRIGRPYDVLRKKGLPHAFFWEGCDGSKVLSWWAQYDALGFKKAAELINGDNDWEQTVCELYEHEIQKFTEASPVDIAWLPQGSDDGLPLKVFNSNVDIDFSGFMKKWNSRETSKMLFSTPPLFFAELMKRQDEIPTFIGTIDPCDVCYNVAWGSEKGLAPLRLKSAEHIADAEKWMAFAHILNIGDYIDTEELWEDCLTASAHASQWVFTEDEAELYGFAANSLQKADDLRNKAMRKITESLQLPEKTIAVAYNSHDKAVEKVLPLTVTCGKIDELVLCDGRGEKLDFQIFEPYEYTDDVWEYRLLVKLEMPANGVNTIAAAKGDISCSSGGKYIRPEKPAVYAASASFSMDNGQVKLEFVNGNLEKVTDIKNMTVMPSGCVNWNTLEFVGIDTDKGSLHAGPETGRSRVIWHEYTIPETGPVRWRCSLKGSNGLQNFTQDIILEAGSNIIRFETATDDQPICAGYLAARIPVANDCKLFGGIPFGSEEKLIDLEPYNGREEGWSDFHRQWDGLFFAKDFTAAKSENATAALCHISGDRYYMYEKQSNSLACLLINCAYQYKDTCEEYMNIEMFQSPGRHDFCHAVIIADENTRKTEIISVAASLRREPVIMRPYRNLGDSYAVPAYSTFAEVDAPNVMLSAVYYQNDDIIIRLWEAEGRSTNACLSLCKHIIGVRAENLIGEEDKTVFMKVEDGTVKFKIGPHEIITLRIQTKGHN